MMWGWARPIMVPLLLLLALLLLLVGCTPCGDQGQATAPSAPSPQVERQAIDNLLALYQEALVAEDSDRLHVLLAPADGRWRYRLPRRPRLPPATSPPVALCPWQSLVDSLSALAYNLPWRLA